MESRENFLKVPSKRLNMDDGCCFAVVDPGPTRQSRVEYEVGYPTEYHSTTRRFQVKTSCAKHTESLTRETGTTNPCDGVELSGSSRRCVLRCLRICGQ
jgi:hypothetical protein